VQALRRVPHTFFDAYFSGRYAQDVCDDGSIFVDRDGEHFGHVLEYMRDGVVSVAEDGACPSVSLLRLLKREFGFYCMELCTERVAEPEQPEMAYVMGGRGVGLTMLSSMERYDASMGQWSEAAAMGTARWAFGACVVAGELYVTGGRDENNRLSSVEKNTPSTDTWSAVAPLPAPRSNHAAVAVGSAMYVLGGLDGAAAIASVLKIDSTQGTWSQVAPMPVANFGMAACTIGSDIYVFGGYDGAQALASIFKYDTEANVWSTLAPMPEFFGNHTCWAAWSTS
jgi:N-acetylneuraminic acid mutarotase